MVGELDIFFYKGDKGELPRMRPHLVGACEGGATSSMS